MSPLQDRETNASEATEDFKEMLDRSFQSQIYFIPGQKTSATVVSVSGNFVFIDLGAKREGFINTSELLNETGDITVKPGDTIEAFFDGTQDGMMRFTTLINGNSSQAIRYIEERAQKGETVEGVVSRTIKGGFEVSVKGIRCFCPQSQMDLRHASDKSVYEGKIFNFKVLEHKENGKGIILSRRILLEEERRKRLEALKETIKEGLDIDCPVKSIQSFGIFVDLGGIEGLIPASEISWGRVEKLEGMFTEGQVLRARVLHANFDAQRITLSLKALQPDPWSDIEIRYPAGSRIEGKVVKLMPFGAFVLVEAGLEGLIHISNLGTKRKIKHPKEVLQEGQLIEAYVLSVDKENRRLSLSLNSLEKKEAVFPTLGEVVEVTIIKPMPFGILAKINGDLTGLIPLSETGLTKGEDPKTFFTTGRTVKTVVKEVDQEKGRVRLSIKDYANKKEAEEYKQYLQEQNNANPQKIGLLGELLEAKIGQKDPTWTK